MIGASRHLALTIGVLLVLAAVAALTAVTGPPASSGTVVAMRLVSSETLVVSTGSGPQRTATSPAYDLDVVVDDRPRVVRVSLATGQQCNVGDVFHLGSWSCLAAPAGQ